MTKTDVKNDLVIVGAVQPVIERFVVAEPLQGERAEFVYEKVAEVAKKEFSGTKAFSGDWSFDKKTGLINGSSLFHLITANRPEILGSMGLRTPSYEEGKMLDSQKKLSNGVYRDFDLVGYNMNNPNSDIASLLMKDMEGKVGFPFKVHPINLRLAKGDTQYGVKISFADHSLVMQGAEAQRVIDSCYYKSKSGVRRLDRDRDGDWGAGWYVLENSYLGGRVDWVCREATRAEIRTATKNQIEAVYEARLDAEVRELQAQRDEALAIFERKK